MLRCGDGIIYIPETLACFGFGGVTDVRAMKDFVSFNFVHLITQLLQFNDAWLKLSEAIDSQVKT